jgi:hypothetical protein
MSRLYTRTFCLRSTHVLNGGGKTIGAGGTWELPYGEYSFGPRWALGLNSRHRVSMDLNLHHPPQVIPSEEKKAREALNRTRAGIACWTWDRVFNSFTGKDPTELGVDSVKLRGEEWFRVSQWNVLDGDATTSAMIAVLKCMYKHRQKIYTDPSAYMGLNLVRIVVHLLDRKAHDHLESRFPCSWGRG